MDWNRRSKMDWTGPELIGLEWIGLEWTKQNGLDWGGLPAITKEWTFHKYRWKKVRKENLQNRRKKNRSGSKSQSRLIRTRRDYMTI